MFSDTIHTILHVLHSSPLVCETDAYFQSKLSLILAYSMALITHEMFSKRCSRAEQLMSVFREFQLAVHPTHISYSKS